MSDRDECRGAPEPDAMLYTSGEILQALGAAEDRAPAPPPRGASRRPPRSAAARRLRVWDREAEARLRALVALHGYRWRRIQAEFGAAEVTDDMLRNKWIRLAGPSGRRPRTPPGRPNPTRIFAPREAWSSQEDDQLRIAVRAANLHLFLPHAARHPPAAWRNRAYRLGLQEDWKRCEKRGLPRLWMERFAAE